MLKKLAETHLPTTGGGTLGTLLRALARHERLLMEVRAHLPKPLRAACQAANLAEGVLTLAVASPAWASRARWFAPGLIEPLRAAGYEIADCRVRVALAPTASPTRSVPPARLSAVARAHLSAAAATMPDPRLADCLWRLAHRGG